MSGDHDRDKNFARLPGPAYAVTWLKKGIRIELRTPRTRGGDVTALCTIECELPGAKTVKGVLSKANLRLSSQSERLARAKHCAERAQTWGTDANGRATKKDEMDFLGMLDEACMWTLEAMVDSEPMIILDDAPDDDDVDHDIEGFRFPADGKGLIIAHGGNMKSLLLLWAAGHLAQRGVPVLYLDWEWTQKKHKFRKRQLFGDTRMDGFHYMKMNASLEREVERVRRCCDAAKIGHVFIDSVGMAADGPLVEDDTAIRFHKALSDLPPSLSAGHIAKSAMEADPKTLVRAFGSVFFENLMRQVWAIRRQPGDEYDETHILALTSTKQNSGSRYPPVGLEFQFGPLRTTIQSINLASIEAFAQSVPLATRMAELLKQGPLTYPDLAEQLGAKVDTVIQTVKRNRQFTKIGGMGLTRVALVERHFAVVDRQQES